MPGERGLREKTARAMDVPAYATGAFARVELTGRNELLITGHAGLLEYSETLVRINCGGYLVTVKGGGFLLTGLERDALCLTGHIELLELSDSGRGGL